MISSKYLKTALAGLMCLAGGTQLSAQIEYDREAFWSQPHIIKSFLGEYEVNKVTEPTIEDEEQVIIRDLIEMITNGGPNASRLALDTLLPQIKPDSSAAFDFIAGQLYGELGDKDNSIRYFEQAIDKHADFLRAINNVAIMKATSGRFESAIKDFTKAIELGQKTGVTMGLLGLCYVNTDKNISAETAYREAIVLDPDTKDWQVGLAQALLRQKKYEEALAVLEQILLDDPENDLLWSSQANAYLGLDDPETAVAIQEIVDRLGKSTPDTLKFMGDIYMSRGLMDLALEYFQRSIKGGGDDEADTHIETAEIMTARGSYPQALAVIADIRKRFSGMLTDEQKLDILRLDARIYIALKKGEEVIPILEQLIERDPLDGQALLLLAEFYSNKGDSAGYARADIFYDRAAKIRDWEEKALLAWARSYVSREKYGDAIPLLERLQVLDPQDHIARYLEQVRKVYLAQLGG